MRAIKSFTVVGLTALLVLGTVAVPAYAATVTTTTVDGISYTADDANVAAGATATGHDSTTGPDVVIPSTVTISGTPYNVTTIDSGAFANNGLTSVSLPDTLTAIGGFAFTGNSLTSLTLPNTLTAIGESVFAYNSLASVTLPNTLTTIGDYAFENNSLTSVTLPDTLTTIGDSAFYGNSLTSVSLPASVTSINDLAFYGNPLTSVRFLGTTPTFFGTDVFTSDPLVSYFWGFGTPRKADGFTSSTWNGYRTQAIAILTYDTNGGTAIDPAEAIVGTTATAPAAAVRTDYTFDGWYIAATGGTAWNFTTDKVAGDMTLFARYAAQVTTTTKGITYTADSTNISAGATATAYDTTFGLAVTIPSTVTIGGTDYTVTTIGDYAFFNKALTSVSLPNMLTTIGSFALAYNSLGSVSVPNSVTTIGFAAFTYDSLTSVTLSNTLTTLGEEAFYGNDLTSVSLPASVTTIDYQAFASNPLTSVRFLGAAPASVGGDVFTSDPLVSYFPRFGDSQTNNGFTRPTWNGYRTGVIAILTYDTNGGTAIDPAEAIVGTTATAPAAAVKADYTFDGWYTAGTGGTAWNFASDIVGGDMTLFARYAAQVSTTTADGITYTADSTNVSAGATATAYNPASGPAVTIPSTVIIGGATYTVTTIGNLAFYNKALTTITLPNTLTTIGNGAFYINSLTSVTLPNTLTTIGYEAFADNKITALTLPDSVTTIGDNAFYRNTLTSLRFLGAAPTSFGTGVFDVNTPVSYFWSFGTSRTAGGFTSPTWNGYRTEAIAIIRYDTAGAPAIDPVEAIVGTTLAAPTNPTKDGYTFDGWYPAETGGTAWNFTTNTVIGDTTLFVRYATVPATSASSGTAALALATTGVTSPAVPAGIGALVLLAGIALLLTRRRRRRTP